MSWGSPGGAVDAVQLRRPVDRRVHGPVATRNAHVPLPRRQDDSQSGGRWRIVVCWRGDGAYRHPRDVAGWLPCSVRECSSERSCTRRRTCPSSTPTGPPGLGSSSSAYVILTLIFNVCMHLNECDDRPLCVCRLTTWRTMPMTRRQIGFWRSTCSDCSEDRRLTPWADAPDQLGQCCSGSYVQGAMFGNDKADE
jgi:hypothetical protein